MKNAAAGLFKTRGGIKINIININYNITLQYMQI